MTSIEKTDDILADVRARRKEQYEKWGRSSHPLPFWMTILAEEVGELSEAILTEDRGEVRAEALDVAAVAVALIEDLTG